MILKYAITIVVILAMVAILYVAAQAMGVAIPAWVMSIFVILLVATVVVMALKYLWSLWQ